MPAELAAGLRSELAEKNAFEIPWRDTSRREPKVNEDRLRLPAAELTLLSLAEVLLGRLWVWLFLGETVTMHTLIGGCVLLAAIAGNAPSAARRKPPAITFQIEA